MNLNYLDNEIEVYDINNTIIKVGHRVVFVSGTKMSKGTVQYLEILTAWIKEDGREQYNNTSAWNDAVFVLTKSQFPEEYL